MTDTMPVDTTASLLQADDLHVYYPRGFRRSPLHALNGVGLRLQPNETLAVVGESGSGKSTLGSTILGIRPPTSGTIRFRGKDISAASRHQRQQLGCDLQAVFQDPNSSLNPVRTIGQSLAEPLTTHAKLPRHEVTERVVQMLDRIGLPASATQRYPAEFSGGQRQRIAIARALMTNPALVVCDEPVSSLDVSVQAQVLNLLAELQRSTGCSYLFISHNLSVVRHFAHRVLVLYRGAVMEQGEATTVCDTPKHPYTRALLAAVPLPDPDIQHGRSAARGQAIRQAAANGGAAAAGEQSCPFAARCPYVRDRCRTERPAPRASADGSTVACHFFAELPPVTSIFELMGSQKTTIPNGRGGLHDDKH